MAKNKTYDHLFKLILIGDSNAGKTDLVFGFVGDSFGTSFVTIGKNSVAGLCHNGLGTR